MDGRGCFSWLRRVPQSTGLVICGTPCGQMQAVMLLCHAVLRGLGGKMGEGTHAGVNSARRWRMIGGAKIHDA